eukprot:6266665-Ditylum_brightwellii.AAC.1
METADIRSWVFHNEKHGRHTAYERAWLKNFRDGLHTIGGILEVMEEWKQPIQQAGDKHLMQEFMESHAVNNKDLEKINYCRMYLKVEHVTDIANPMEKGYIHSY